MTAPHTKGEAKAVILAGGRGTRLEPYTSILPKPLMPIGRRPILEILLDQLRANGITDVTLCVGYLAHLIRAVLESGDNGASPGSGRAQKISYVHESEPLGTAGPLRLIEPPTQAFVVMNGDILTTLSYSELLEEHRAAGNAVTIATNKRVSKIDYGVLGVSTDGQVASYTEKPEVAHVVSMGIYVLEPSVLSYVPRNEYFDFPTLVSTLLDNGVRVGSFEYSGLWLDIGRREDYEEACRIWPADDDASAAGPEAADGIEKLLTVKRAWDVATSQRPVS